MNGMGMGMELGRGLNVKKEDGEGMRGYHITQETARGFMEANVYFSLDCSIIPRDVIHRPNPSIPRGHRPRPSQQTLLSRSHKYVSPRAFLLHDQGRGSSTPTPDNQYNIYTMQSKATSNAGKINLPMLARYAASRVTPFR